MASLGSGVGLVIDVAIYFKMKPSTPGRRAKTKVDRYETFAPLVRSMFGLANVKTSISRWEPDENGAKTTLMY